MQPITTNAVSLPMQRDADIKSLPPNFVRRLLWSLPLMVVAGGCLFNFFATFEPMPRIAQLSWRAFDVCAGFGSVITICWLWLRPRKQTEISLLAGE